MDKPSLRRATPKPGSLGVLIGRTDLGRWYVRAHLEDGMVEAVCGGCGQVYEREGGTRGESTQCEQCARARRTG